MPSAVQLREDYSAPQLRRLAARTLGTQTRAGGFYRWRQCSTV
jgi:hypothetical protein